MCSGSEAGSYLRLIDFVYHSTLGLSVIKKKKEPDNAEESERAHQRHVRPGVFGVGVSVCGLGFRV